MLIIFKKLNTSKILGFCMKSKFNLRDHLVVSVLWCLKKKKRIYWVTPRDFLPLLTHLLYFSLLPSTVNQKLYGLSSFEKWKNSESYNPLILVSLCVQMFFKYKRKKEKKTVFNSQTPSNFNYFQKWNWQLYRRMCYFT